MRPDEVKKLIGGYATGTLTEAERQALFAAALEDQDLFDELAREQTLHDVLRDPGARAEMLEAVAGRRRAWAWWRPAAAALAAAAIGAVVLVAPRKHAPETQPPRIVAEVKPPEPVFAPPPAKIETPPPAAAAPPPKAKVKPFQPPPAPAPPPVPAADTVMLAEAPKPAAPKTLPGGVVGGVLGGTPGGVLGGIIGAPRDSMPPPPPPVKLETAARPSNAFVPSTAETVEVTAAAPLVRDVLSARSLFYGRAVPTAARLRVQSTATTAQRAEPAAPRGLGLRYSVVRKDGDSFVPADPASLSQSDTLALRFTANVNGYLSIAGAKPVALTAMEPYTTPPLPAGTADFRVIFARSPQTAIATPVSLVTEVDAGEVYAVNTTPGAPIAFTVTVKRK